jgi:hypothetical protein
MADPRQSVPERRYTLMWVPQGGQDRVRQLTLSLREMRWVVFGASLAVGLAVVGVIIMLGSLPRSAACDSLLEENLALKSRLQDIDRRLSEGEEQLRRLRLYEGQLDDLGKSGFPGYGPVDPDEALDLGLEPGDGIVELDIDPITGEFGIPMHELDGIELEPAQLSATDAWVLDIQGRAERLLELARLIEPEIGVLVETAEDQRARRSAFPSIWPVKGIYTSGFGYRRSPFTKVWKFHSGIDISAPRGTKVRAGASGLVVTAEYTGGYGKLVEIDHGYGVVTRYAHNAQMFIRAGDIVQQGQVISTVGTTGHSTGPHLHFEVMVDAEKVNPLAYLPRRRRAKQAKRAKSPAAKVAQSTE